MDLHASSPEFIADSSRRTPENSEGYLKPLSGKVSCEYTSGSGNATGSQIRDEQKEGDRGVLRFAFQVVP